MFRKFVLLAMVIFVFSLLSGCATMQARSNETMSIVLEELDHVKEPFILVYSELGGSVLVCPQDKSPERYANLSNVLLEPGFMVLMSEKAHRNGLSDDLEEIFRKEKFFLQNSKLENGTFRMIFARPGKTIFVHDC